MGPAWACVGAQTDLASLVAWPAPNQKKVENVALVRGSRTCAPRLKFPIGCAHQQDNVIFCV
uniref:Uncharacterized protein n=1 Tax=Arundo donax TaxID=35708 RepID=A0A0A8Y663_ARUDO